MDEVLFRTALSPGIREQHDEFPLIADPSGKMVVGQFGLSIPDFLAGYDGRSRRATSCSPRTPTPAAPRSATPTTGSSSSRSSTRAASSAGRRCSATCPTSAARPRRRCRPTPARSTRGRRHPALQALREGRRQRGRAAGRPQPGADAGLEPRRPQRSRRRLPHRGPPGRRDVRAVRHGDVPRLARGAAAAQLRRDEGPARVGPSRRGARSRSPTTSATTASATAPTS